MSVPQYLIRKGRAVITANGLRCQGPRKNDPTLICNKLLVHRTDEGQVAGQFKCGRCGQIIEVAMVINS
jgi:hypothetical protein